jgi:hypothetical protein
VGELEPVPAVLRDPQGPVVRVVAEQVPPAPPVKGPASITHPAAGVTDAHWLNLNSATRFSSPGEADDASAPA